MLAAQPNNRMLLNKGMLQKMLLLSLVGIKKLFPGPEALRCASLKTQNLSGIAQHPPVPQRHL
ncbi:hypothetical protein D3C81_2017610 [compost metagenome]